MGYYPKVFNLFYIADHGAQKTKRSTEAADEPASARLTLLSITSVILIVAYFVICSLNYACESVTIGWFIVISTAILIAAVAIRSFQTRATFRLGFAVFGNLWLASVLGFALETPNGFSVYDLRALVREAMSFGSKFLPIEDYSRMRRSTSHDLYRSITVGRHPNGREIPNGGNTMRLVACWSPCV